MAGQGVGSPGGGGSGGGGPAIDPLKLLTKYLWVLVLAAVLGIGVGVGAYVLLSRVAPEYTSVAIFEVKPQELELGRLTNEIEDNERLARLMQTEATTMVSRNVLTSALENPAMQSALPEWFEPFTTGGTVNIVEAFLELEQIVSATPSADTTFIRLSVRTGDPQTGQTINDFVVRSYQEELLARSRSPVATQREQILNAIDSVQEDISLAQRQRRRLIAENGIESTTAKDSRAGRALEDAVTSLSFLEESKTATEVQLEEYRRSLDNPSGITYPDDILSAVEQLPSVQGIQQQIRVARAEDNALEAQGFGERYVERISLAARIRGFEDELSSIREIEARRLFNERIAVLRLGIQQYEQREAELLANIERNRSELEELNQVLAEVEDIDTRIMNLEARLSGLQSDAQSLQQLATNDSTVRVKLVQRPTQATEPSFPQLIQIVPAGFILLTGLTAGVIVLIELTDQRVKGPADIAMIPRTRVLGIIPDAAQDPARPKRPETAFFDHPQGVFAEAVRQLRAPLLKRAGQQGHKTVLIVPSTPQSGATTVISNLAEACARADMRVLVLDANGRRPGLHAVFDQPEAPGLADVTAGVLPLDQVIRETATPNLYLLPAGSSQHRAYERIATPRMDEVLAEVRERFDIVLIDVAPAIVSGDAMGLASRVDATVLVARAFNEKRGMVARLKNGLVEARGEFLGVVVNAVRPSAGGYFKQNMQATHEYQSRPGVDAA